jgi:hypothetical protein
MAARFFFLAVTAALVASCSAERGGLVGLDEHAIPSSPSFALSSAPASPVYYDGAHLQVPGRDAVMLYFGGKFWEYPDWETLLACTGGRSSIIQSTDYLPPSGVPIPSVIQNSWVCGGRPVRSSRTGEATVYVLEGGVLSPIDTEARYEAIYGDRSYSRLVMVDPVLLARFPMGPIAAAVRARRAGSLVGNPTGEVSWTLWHGARLGIATAAALQHHCRSFSEVVSVNSTEYSAYTSPALLHDRVACGAAQPTVSCPTGWTPASSGRGVSLCSRWSASRSVTDYVLLVNLKRGARISNLFHAESQISQDNPSPEFIRRSMDAWWQNYAAVTTRFCMVGGAFFGESKLDYVTASTRLSYPLKDVGSLMTTGSDLNTAWTRILYLDRSAAWIDTYKLMWSNNLAEVKAELAAGPNALVVHERYAADDNTMERKTFAAVRDDDGDGRSEVVLFFVSPKASEIDANAILNVDFGVRREHTYAVALDSGHSTQLKCRSGSHVPSYRDLPFMFVALEAVS